MNRHQRKASHVLVAVIGLMLALPHASAQQQGVADWEGNDCASGFWYGFMNFCWGAQPSPDEGVNSMSWHAIIADVAPAEVTLDGDTTLDQLTVFNESHLIMQNGRSITLRGTNFYEDPLIESGTLGIATGTLTMGSTGANTNIRFIGGDSLLISPGAPGKGFTGTLLMSDSMNNRIYDGEALGRLLSIDNGITIRGAGQIGLNQTWIENHGAIIGLNAAAPLVIDPVDSQPFMNFGLLRAEGPDSILRLAGGVYINDDSAGFPGAGEIQAQQGVVELDGATVRHGTLGGLAPGTFRAGPTFNPTIHDVELIRGIEVPHNRSLTLQDGIVNHSGNGAITLTGVSTLWIGKVDTDGVQLSGHGEVVLTNFGGNVIRAVGGTGVLHNVNNTIRGTGQIGLQSASLLDLVNEGKILADQTDQVLAVTRMTSEVENSGQFGAANGGILQVRETSIHNLSGGELFADADSTIVGTQLGVTDGSINGEGTFTAGAVFSNPTTLDNVALNIATTEVAHLRVNGDIANNSNILLNVGGGNGSKLDVNGDRTIHGNGMITFDVGWFRPASAPDTLTLGPGQVLLIPDTNASHTIDAGLALVNQGIIEIDGDQLIRAGSDSLENDGTIEIINGGELLFGTASSLVNRGDITIDSASSITGNFFITFENGAVTVNGSISPNNSILQIGGALRGTGSILANSWMNVQDGTVEPGSEPGAIGTLTMNWFQSGPNSHTILDIAGPESGVDHDRILVNNVASLGGTLKIELPPGYLPSVRETFSVLTAATVNGNFDEVVGPGQWSVAVEGTDVIVRFDAPPPMGDLNGDNSVGVPDLLLLLAQWGDCPSPPAACPADLDGSGAVGVPDLLLLLQNWI